MRANSSHCFAAATTTNYDHQEEEDSSIYNPPVWLGDKDDFQLRRKKRPIENLSLVSTSKLSSLKVTSPASGDVTSNEESWLAVRRTEEEEEEEERIIYSCECGNPHCGLVDNEMPSMKQCQNANAKEKKCSSGIQIFKDCKTNLCRICYYNRVKNTQTFSPIPKME